MTLRVLIVDDSREIQGSLGTLLGEPSDDIEVVGCATDRASAQRQVDRCRPDLVVLDVALARHDRGYDVLCDLHRAQPDLPVVMLSNFGWSAMRSAFLAAGAQAYFDKAREFEDAVHWIRRQARAGTGAASATPPEGPEPGPAG